MKRCISLLSKTGLHRCNFISNPLIRKEMGRGRDSRFLGWLDAVQEASVRVESDSGASRTSNRGHWRLSGPMDSPSMADRPVGCCPRPL